MSASNLPPEYVAWARSLAHTKRGAALLEYLIEHGSVTTEEIREHLGEKHPPSAVRDLRDRGVAVRTAFVGGIGQYTLDPDAPIREGLIGRQGFSKAFKQALVRQHGSHCGICGSEFGSRYLQPDHRVPQRVGGDELDKNRRLDDYMPVCRPCNRAKSSECERCPNWGLRVIETCRTCYWAYPDTYVHVATRPERRLDLVWSGQEEVAEFDSLRKKAGRRPLSAQVKDAVRSLLRR